MWGRNNHRAAQEEEEEKCWPEGERDCELKGELVGGFKLEHNTHNVYVCHAMLLLFVIHVRPQHAAVTQRQATVN